MEGDRGMNFTIKKILGTAVLFVLAGSVCPAQNPPDAAVIVDRVIKRDKELQERRKGYDYDLTVTREKLKEDQSARETTEDKSVVVADRRPDYDTRSGLSAEQEAEKASKEEPFELLKVIDHFSYALAGTEEVNGIPCYKVAYKPKPDMPYRNREEKVINQVTGFLWVSQKDYSLMRNSGTLSDPVQVGWIFATLKELEFSYESQLLPNGDYGPKKVAYRFLVDIPFGQIHERHTRRMARYRTSGGEKAAVKAEPPKAPDTETAAGGNGSSVSSSKH